MTAAILLKVFTKMFFLLKDVIGSCYIVIGNYLNIFFGYINKHKTAKHIGKLVCLFFIHFAVLGGSISPRSSVKQHLKLNYKEEIINDKFHTWITRAKKLKKHCCSLMIPREHFSIAHGVRLQKPQFFVKDIKQIWTKIY